MNSSLMCLYGEAKPSSLVKAKTAAETHHVCLYGKTKPSSLVKAKTAAKPRHVCLYDEVKPVEQLGIDEAAKRGRRTRNIGAALGERVGNHEVGAQRSKRWRDARLSNLASTMLRNASIGRETSERLLVSVAS